LCCRARVSSLASGASMNGRAVCSLHVHGMVVVGWKQGEMLMLMKVGVEATRREEHECVEEMNRSVSSSLFFHAPTWVLDASLLCSIPPGFMPSPSVASCPCPCVAPPSSAARNAAARSSRLSLASLRDLAATGCKTDRDSAPRSSLAGACLCCCRRRATPPAAARPRTTWCDP